MADLSPNSILFNTSGSPIGTTFDGTNTRLCVDSRPYLGVSAQQQAWGAAPAVQTLAVPLVKSGSPALNVNGSSTPVTFSMPSNTKLQTIYALRLVFTFTTVTFNGSNFGAAAITNGISIGYSVGGSTGTIYTIKTNEDFYLANGGGLLTSAGTGILVTSVVLFNQPLGAGSTDTITVTISDNLTVTNILYGRALAYGMRAP